jgi:putative addiction module component (TIGR02574 family)
MENNKFFRSFLYYMALEDFPDIVKLSTEDKIMLVEELWESIRSESISNPIPKSHEQELNERQKTLDEGNLLSLEDLKERFKK